MKTEPYSYDTTRYFCFKKLAFCNFEVLLRKERERTVSHNIDYPNLRYLPGKERQARVSHKSRPQKLLPRGNNMGWQLRPGTRCLSSGDRDSGFGSGQVRAQLTEVCFSLGGYRFVESLLSTSKGEPPRVSRNRYPHQVHLTFPTKGLGLSLLL